MMSSEGQRVTFKILSEVAQECDRQDEKWGEQNHPDGTGGITSVVLANNAKAFTDRAGESGDLTWRDILNEEVLEAFAEDNPVKLRAELIQVAAVATHWAEAIDRR